MRHDLDTLKIALEGAPFVRVEGELARVVPFLDLTQCMPPNWLYTSGRANRYNPAGIDCLYLSDSTKVAQAEYENVWQGTVGEHQPVTTFFANVQLRRVLDLTDAATLKHLKLETRELLKNWRRAKRPTATQLLGQAISESRAYSAIRYPSAASGARSGVNFVIFRDCVRSPDYVKILGPTRKPLDRWP